MLIATTYSTSPTATGATAPVDTVTQVVDPEFQVSKKYPTIGYITSQAKLTIEPLTFEEIMAFWDTYATGSAYGFFCGTSEKQKRTQKRSNEKVMNAVLEHTMMKIMA